MALNMDLINKTAQGAVGDKYNLVQTTPKPLKIDMSKVTATADAAVGSMNQPTKPLVTPTLAKPTATTAQQPNKLGQLAKNLGYGFERSGAALLGFGENTLDAISGGVNTGLAAATSLFGLVPNKVSDFFQSGADLAFDQNKSPYQAYEQSIERRYNPTDIQRTIGNYGESAIQMLPTVAASVGAANLATKGANVLKTTLTPKAASNAASSLSIALNSAGSSANEAKSEGATTGQAARYGAAAGALEAGIEAIAGGIPGLPPGIVSNVVKTFTNSPIVSTLLDVLGEGGEEALSRYITPYLKRAVYDKSAPNATGKEIAESAIAGMALAGIMQGANAVSNIGAKAKPLVTPQLTTQTQQAAQPVKPVDLTPKTAQTVKPTYDTPAQPFAEINLQKPTATVPTQNATQTSAAAAGIKVYRGYNRSADATEKNLVGNKTIFDVLGKPQQSDEMLPLQYYTENEDVANSYATQDVDFLGILKENAKQEYRRQYMNNGVAPDGLSESEWIDKYSQEQYKTLTGKELPAKGETKEHTIYPKNTFDISELGETTTVDDVYKALSKATGISENDLDDKLMLMDIPGIETSDEEFQTYSLLRNKSNSKVGTRVYEFLKELGYDAVRYAEQGTNQYAVFPSAAQSVTAQPVPARQAAKTVDIQDRNFSNVGDRSVKAFQFEHPELHDHYSTAATYMQYDLDLTTKGERKGIKDADGYYVSGWGTKRKTNKYIAKLLDDANLSYDQISKALDNIIQNHGQENYAAAKKVEVVLDEILSKGYETLDGMSIPADADYISARDKITGVQTQIISSADTEDLPIANKERLQAVNAPSDTVTASVDDAAGTLPEGMGAMSKKYAKVLTTPPITKTPLAEKLKSAADYLSRKFTDSGNTINTIGKRTGDQTLYQEYNNAKQASAAANNMLGEQQTNLRGDEVVGESLKAIFDPIKAKGEDYYQDFSNYLMHRHNTSRMTLDARTDGKIPNKPVFGEAIDAINSRDAAQELERKHPEFKELAQKVYNYNRNLMKLRVESGLISQQQADEMNTLYPYYVPTYRDMNGISGSKAGSRTVQINQGIKRATGSERDILPVDLSMARQTMQTVQAAKRNIFGNRLLENAKGNLKTLGDHIVSIEEMQEYLGNDVFFDDDPQTDIGLGLDNTFIIFKDGKPVQMKVSNAVYDGLKALSSTDAEGHFVYNAAVKINDTFKRPITGWNPVFAVKNFVRDPQDAVIYSKDYAAFIKAYPEAIEQIATNGEYWQQYKALGGLASSFFDYETGLKPDSGKFKKWTLDKIEQLNIAIEAAPRLAEFIATVKKGDGSYENLMEAMYNAAEVTVNFGRSGTLGKQLNKTLVPFFNPAIQGASKTIRTITETKSVKPTLKLIEKAAIFGVLPSIINALLYGDDDEWEKISDRDKDIYYLIKLKDGYWMKIPKGRVASVLGGFSRRLLELASGEKDAFKGFGEVVIAQIGPVNPLTSNIFAPWISVSTNRTWYGTPIEGDRLQGYKPSERYDESTDSFSKWLGGVLDYSPKKINYLLDSYTGVIGDFALPLMTPKAESNPFSKAFVLDSTSSNKISEEFYNKADELKYDKNSAGSDPSLVVVNRFYNRQMGAVSDLYKEIRAVENSKLKDSEKKTQIRELKAVISGIQQNALTAVEEYAKAAKENYTGDTEREIAASTLQTDWDIFGAEYAIKTNLSEQRQGQAKEAAKLGVSADNFLKIDLQLKAPAATKTQTASELAVKKLTPLLTPDLRKYVSSTKTTESASDLSRLLLLQNKDLTAKQKSYLDTALIGELKAPRDYTNEDKFILSLLTASQQKKYDTVKERLGFTPRQYSVYLSAISKDKDTEIWKKADQINALKAAGLSQSQAFMFVKIMDK